MDLRMCRRNVGSRGGVCRRAAALAQHKGQVVVRASLSVTATGPEIKDKWEASGSLRLWVRNQEESFDSHGACNTKAGGQELFSAGS
jgi:hypothetical protein